MNDNVVEKRIYNTSKLLAMALMFCIGNATGILNTRMQWREFINNNGNMVTNVVYVTNTFSPEVVVTNVFTNWVWKSNR